MVAHNIDEILRELDRTQGGPVQFEDSRTGARYVLIPHDAYRFVRPLLGKQDPREPPADWNEKKNDRRLALIKKEVAGQLNEDEHAILEQLQDEFYRYREQLAPLPSAMLELLEEALERRAAEQRQSAAS